MGINIVFCAWLWTSICPIHTQQIVISTCETYDNSLDVSLSSSEPGWNVSCFPSFASEFATCGGALNAGVTYESNTNTYFIGPFSGPDNGGSFNNLIDFSPNGNPDRLVHNNSWKIRQSFYCSENGKVNVIFNSYWCGVTEGDGWNPINVYDYVRLFIQYQGSKSGVEIQGDYPNWNYISNTAENQLQIASSCSETWRYNTFNFTYPQEIESSNSFEVQFEIGMSGNNEFTAVEGVKIECIPPTGPSPCEPTTSPTAAPSEAPIPLLPTPSPTDSDNKIYVNINGSDSQATCSNKTYPCLSLSHAYDCFIGKNGCNDNDGNGEINLGEGNWEWPVDLMYDNEQIIINGAGMNKTYLYYNDLVGIGCKWKKCWLEINNLTLMRKNESQLVDNKQIYIHQGGSAIFNNVLFDGNNYDGSANKHPLWLIEGEKVSVIINSCIFRNVQNVFYSISNAANVQIINSLFEGITSDAIVRIRVNNQ